MKVKSGIILFACLAVLIGLAPIKAYADQTVYTTETGKKYHRTRNCNGLNNANDIFTATESNAIDRGLKKCDKCWKAKAITTDKKKFVIDGSSKADIGDGSVYLENANGTTKNGKPLRESVSSDLTMTQIGFESEGFNKSKLTFIYIDGRLNSKKHIGETKGTLNISGEDLAQGLHNVEFVQYKGKPSYKNLQVHKSAEYKIIIE